MKPCRKCKQPPNVKAPLIVPPKSETEPTKIELPEPTSGDIRRSLVGKTIRIRLKPPV